MLYDDWQYEILTNRKNSERTKGINDLRIYNPDDWDKFQMFQNLSSLLSAL